MDFLHLLKGPYPSIVNFIEYCQLKTENCQGVFVIEYFLLKTENC